MDWFGIKRRDIRSFEVWLDICMQMDLEQYPTPDTDDPRTWETEHREYIVTDDEMEEWIKAAQKQAEIYLLSSENCKALERLGTTYGEVHRIHTGDDPNIEFPGDNALYEADEDLMFLYERLSVLHRFVFEAKVEKDNGKEAIQASIAASSPVGDSMDEDAESTSDFESEGSPPF
jgi:hypothetical protein